MADAGTMQTPGKERIGRQIVLPLSKAFEIAWGGIRIRLWRSLITMSGIVLAIAFLSSVWTSGAFTSELRQVEPTHELYPLAQGVLEAQALAGGGVAVECVVLEGDVPPVSGEITPAESIRNSLDGMNIFRAQKVPPGPDAIVGLATGREGTPPDALISVGVSRALQREDVVEAVLDFVDEGGLFAIYGTTGLPEQVSGTPLAQLLPAEPGAETFTVGAGEVSEPIHIGAPWDNMPETTILSAGGRPEAESLAVSGDRTVVWGQGIGDGMVVWYPVTGDSVADGNHVSWFLRARLLGTEGAGDQRGSLMVRLVAYALPEQFSGQEADVRGIWLVGLSLMVCVVGITNAMLMSVTERFREIGTMKCLGALDKFIVKLFLIESSLQGIVGSVLGALIGFLLAFLRSLFAFHAIDPETGESYWLATHFFPGTALLGWMGVALVTGVALTIVAAIYPAMRAARMEPVEAMRVEA
ncbi:MAG: FtsX-like permease family protein [Candidatus Brocadiia bacterium]